MSGNDLSNVRKSLQKQSDNAAKERNHDFALPQYTGTSQGATKQPGTTKQQSSMHGTSSKNLTLLKSKTPVSVVSTRTLQTNGNPVTTIATSSTVETTSTTKTVATADQSKNDNIQITSDTRNKVIQYYVSMIDNLRMNYQESLQQLFFIQSGGNMVDYPAWKLRPTSHLMSYLASHRLDDTKIPISSNSSNISGKSASNIEGASQHLAQKSSTKDNGSSVEQYGFVQGIHHLHDDKKSKHVDSKLGIHKNIDNKQLVQTSSGSTRQPSTSGSDIVGQVRHESETLHRISELRKNGLWSASRLPKVFELPKKKSHHDFMLEEMQWLATDFAQEKRWKRNMAKKVFINFNPYFNLVLLFSNF